MTATDQRQGREASAPIVRDEVLRLGPEGQLVGVVSHPSGEITHRAPAHAVVILNAGVLHRVGPHRLHVILARRLAAMGFAGLRLDLGGIGDSIASTDATTFRESAVADTRVAMTGLAAVTGARRFVIFGVCAGADNALATALADDRVAGIILVDPAAYSNRWSKLRELRSRIAAGGAGAGVRVTLRVARREVLGRLERRLERRRRRRAGESESESTSGGRELPPIATFRADLAALAARGVRICAVYSGIHRERYNHAGQLFELFPELRGRIDVEYFPGANHTFTELGEQGALVTAITRWISTRFA